MDGQWTKVSSGNSRTTENWNMEEQKEISGKLIDVAKNLGDRNATKYVIETNGKQVGVWGSAMLDRLMQSVGVGDEIRIVYLGKDRIEGGKTLKKFDLFKKNAGTSTQTDEQTDDVDSDIPF